MICPDRRRVSYARFCTFVHDPLQCHDPLQLPRQTMYPKNNVGRCRREVHSHNRGSAADGWSPLH